MPDAPSSRRLGLQAAAAGLAGAFVSFALLPWPEAGFGTALAILAALVTAVDLDRYIIPDGANAAILAGGILLCLWEAPQDLPRALLDGLLRAAVAGGFLYAVRLLYHHATGVVGLGLGDVKLAAAAGPWLGWGMLPVALELSALAALIAVGLTALRRRAPIDRRLALPFGAFLAPAVWASFVIERYGLPGWG